MSACINGGVNSSRYSEVDVPVLDILVKLTYTWVEVWCI